MSTTFTSQSIDLIYPGEAATTDGWYVSHWNAGQSSILTWSTDNVRINAAGAVEFVLCAAPPGAARPYLGGEVQSIEQASTGTWSWTVQAPQMVDGAVFGLFTYRADHVNDPWIEFDIEFVGANTRQVRLNIHMEYVDASGQIAKITLEEAMGGPVIVDLGFDASQGLHSYDIVVTDTEAIFLVDGAVVGRFDASHMGGVWTSGEMKGFTNLWCVDPSLKSWAGPWVYPGEPLVATVSAMDVRPGDLGEFGPTCTAINGDQGANDLVGTDGNDIIDGKGGDDTLAGGSGDDTLLGGDGNDILTLLIGNDTLDGGSGLDWVRSGGAAAATIDLALTTAQDTGYGLDTLRAIENALGGAGADSLSGDDGANILKGDLGHDILAGRGGDDRLEGGADNDDLDGGAGHDQVLGGDGNDTLSLDLGDDGLDGGAGLADWIRVSGSVAAVIDLAKTTAQATGYGNDTLRNIENASGGSGADKLYGGGGANILFGNAGDDLLRGRTGADTLVGGLGRDTLYGGAQDGACDVFVFGSRAESLAGSKRDVIYEFEAGAAGLDVIDVSGMVEQVALPEGQAFGFSGTTAQAYSIWYTVGRSEVVVKADVTGDKTADFEIRLVGVSALTSGDFSL